jgi:hypothetical protein
MIFVFMFPSLFAKLNHWDDNPGNAFTGQQGEVTWSRECPGNYGPSHTKWDYFLAARAAI